MDLLLYTNFIISIVFFLCYFYQFVYIVVGWFKFKSPKDAGVLHKFAILISARNEQNVIANLIESINAQDYPADKIQIFVVADNCTDNTASIAGKCGAVVYERVNARQIGKGYALDFLLSRIDLDYGIDSFDGYFVFDADNLLQPNYVSEMNKTFSDGYEVVTSYRNSKNYGDNWISAGYALWFLREARYLNQSRMMLKTSCAVSGTGFLVSSKVFRDTGGWKFFLLTEDIEFSTYNIIHGRKIGYCRGAMFFDEQPVTFRQSWHQRMRWSKGFLQVFGKYGKKLIRGAFLGNFSCYDMSMTIMPALLLSTLSILVNTVSGILGIIIGDDLSPELISVLGTIVNMYVMLFVVGAITTITEWKNIHTSTAKKIFYTFTFPLFMFTYVPIALVSIFKKVEWTPIDHTRAASLEEVLHKQ